MVRPRHAAGVLAGDAATAAPAGIYVLALRGVMRRWLGDEMEQP